MADQNPGYKGEFVAIACGNGGLNQNQNPSKILLKNVIQAEGVSFYQDSWRKEAGTALFGTNTTAVVDPADKVIVALYDWHPTEIVQRLVTLRGDGYVYFTSNGGTNPGAFQSATTSGTGTRFGYFIAGGSEGGGATRKLFLLRSNQLPSYVNGDVTTDTVFSGANFTFSDWTTGHPPICGVVNAGGGVVPQSGGTGGRLFLSGVSTNPHMIWASKFGDMTDFKTNIGNTSDYQTISVFPGIGERIYGMVNYQGFIAVFKYPRGVFLLDARDTDPANWFVQLVTDQVGIAQTPYAALRLENDCLFMGPDGQFYLLSAVIAAATGQQNMRVANLGMDLDIYQFLLEAYNRAQLSKIQSVYYPFWQTAQFTIPGPGSTTNTTRFIFDFNAVGRKGGEPRFSYSFRDTAASLALRRDPNDFIDKPLYGDYLSNVILLEQDARSTWNGHTYPMRLQTPHTNLGQFENLEYDKFVQFANRNKLFDLLEVEYLPLTPATITVSIFIDGILRGPPFTLDLRFGGAALDSFILDTDTLGSGTVRSIINQALRVGSGRRISILFENVSNGEDIALTHFFLGFRPSDTTQSPRI